MASSPFSPVSVDNNIRASSSDEFRLADAIVGACEFAIITVSPGGIVTSFNQGAEKLLGYKADELIGKNIQVLHDEHELSNRADKHYPKEERYLAVLSQDNGTQFNDNKPWTYIAKTGRHIPVMISCTALLHNETLLGYSIIAIDISEQLRIQKKKEETERQLQALISSIDDIVFEMNYLGQFKNIWVRSDDYLFFKREEIYGKTIRELFGEEFALPFEEGMKKVVDTGETFTWEYHSPAPGDMRWFSAKCALVFENDQTTDRISICIRNITHQKKIELELRESEEKFRLLAENIPAVVYLMHRNAADTLVYINREIETITGYTVKEFHQGEVKLGELIHRDDQVYVTNVRDHSVQHRLPFQLEYRIQHHSGAWKWVSETGIGVYGTEGSTFIEGYITDITQRKESEDELRRMADENSRIFNNTILMSALASFDGYFRKLNPAWEKTLGWSRDELLSNKFISFVHPDDIFKTEEVIKLIASGHAVSTFENRYRCKDGSYRWLLWTSSPDISRKIIYASAIDITSRKRQEEELLLSKRNLEVAASELEEQNRQLDEFAHIISHNLRAPVGNIKALLNFITETSTVTDYQLIFEKIKNVTFNISETMNELLETIRIKKNLEVERIELRFKDILDRVIQSLEGELIQSGATITYDFNHAPKIFYSKLYLESILQNLISNAIKYRSPSRIPEIHISTDLVNTGIELRVRDNGLGIDLERYGNKLFGLHKTFHENKEAKGVGLFLTKTQIETLGGTISAESKVDEGTTFIIHF